MSLTTDPAFDRSENFSLGADAAFEEGPDSILQQCEVYRSKLSVRCWLLEKAALFRLPTMDDE